MVIPTALYYLFAPLLVVLVGVMAERMGSPKLRDGFSILASIWGIVSVWMLFNMLQASPDKILVITIGGNPPLAACLEIDALSIYMAFSAALLGFFANVYSYSYMDHDTRLTEYYTLIHALVVGIIGVALAGDLFTLFIFWETMGISSYALVSFRKDTPGPIEAGFKYMIMGSVGSTILFFGAALLYGMTGTLNLAQMSSVLRGQAINPWMYLVFAMLIVGFGVKSAIVPMHTWLPDAHPEAPSPISAMLSGIVIETGLYAMVRVLFLLFEPSFFTMPMMILAIITMSLGNIMALLQTDLKRLLAYSSIAQIGYMLIGVSTGLSYGLLGTFMHVFNHSLMKGIAFLAAGNIVHETGTRDINEMQGVGRMMPLTTLAITIAFLGLGGVPGTSGFISKFILFNASLGAGIPILAVVGVLNSTLSMAYYLRVIMTLLSGKMLEGKIVKEAPLMMVGVTLVMSILVIALGLYPSSMMGISTDASEALIRGLVNYIGAVLR